MNEIPDSPNEMGRRWAMKRLDDLPPGSEIKLSVEQCRKMLLDYYNALDLIQRMKIIIENNVPND
jgi:hypothetical protein